MTYRHGRRFRIHCAVLETLEPRELLSASDPAAREQYMFELLNRFRANPVQELPLLLTSGDANIISALKTFNVNLPALYDAFSTLTAVAPVAWSVPIYTAAYNHDLLMRQFDTQSHQLPGEADIGGRITAVGYNWNEVGENVYAYADDPLYGDAGFVIDWGTGTNGVQSPPGHRDNMLDASFRDSATAVIDGVSGAATGPLLVTQDFANQPAYGNPMLTGVVFNDADNDGYYSSGEGEAGVSVRIVGGTIDETLATLTAGMYQAQLPAGSYSVVYTGSFGTRVQNVRIGAANVELDLNTSLAKSTTTSVAVTGASVAGFTLSATVTGSSGLPTGTVTFYNGTTVVGTAALSNGTATLVTNALPKATDLLIAVYNGSTAYQKSVSSIDEATLSDTVPPAVSAIHIPDYTNFAATYTFTVTYTDNGSLNVATLKDGTAIFISGPRGFTATANYVSIDKNSNGATRTVTYSLSAPGGSWNSLDSGVYGVQLLGGKIADVAGNVTGAQGLSNFNVAPGPFFDEQWYLAHNPDVAAAVASGALRSGYDHFLHFGQFEGRAPSVYFNENYYLAHNPDVAAAVHAGAFASGFAHFIFFGQREGRSANPFFDERVYLGFNPDVAAAVRAGQFTSGYEHYLLYGAVEKRKASAYFDAVYYLAANPDVNTAVNRHQFTSAFAHFMLYGLAEHRAAQGYFDQVYYLAHNPDVAAAVSAGLFISAYDHYVLFGQFEHRDPSALYDDDYYLAHNSDVAAAVADGLLESGFEHWVLYGQFEGRVAHA